MGDKKERLFEMMEKVNPEFKVNEIMSPSGMQQTVSPDAAYAAKATINAPNMQYANSRIDTPKEFEQAFKAWFATTGFNPQKKPLAISQAQTIVKNAMMSLGYK